MIDISNESIATVLSLIILLLIKEVYKYFSSKGEKAKVADKIEASNLMHLNIIEGLKSNTDTLKKLERHASIASDEYTRILPVGMIKENAERVFRLARREIFLGVRDLTDKRVNWNDGHVRDSIYSQVTKMIENIYNNDVIYLSDYEYEDAPVSDLMDVKWKKKIVRTCHTFIDHHFTHENGFDSFAINLKNDFEKINFEFINRL